MARLPRRATPFFIPLAGAAVRTLLPYSPLLTLLFAIAPAFAADPPKPDSRAIDRLVEDARKSWDVPGVAVVVVRGGEVVHLKGYGNKTLGADSPVTPDTLFPLASCTKAFTAAAIARLVDDGKMDWDDPVRKHLPAFRLSDPAADKLVTIRDLLAHRSGVGGHDLLWYRAAWDLDESVRRIPQLPLAAPFRGGYVYSSLTVLAAGRAAANRADEDWDELVRAAVCRPLGMKPVAFTTKEAAKVPDRADGHRLTAAGKVERMPEYAMAEPNPAGSMFATARGLGEWVKFQLADGKVGKEQVISAKNLGETRQPHTPMRRVGAVKAVYPESKQVSYALGWVVYDHRGELVVAHGGQIDGFRAHVTLLPERGVGFALLSNLHESKANMALANALVDQLLGLPAKDWNAYFRRVDADEAAEKAAEKAVRDKARRPGVKATLPLDRYVGEYAADGYGTGKVTKKGGALAWEWSTFRCPLEHWQGDTFRVTGGFFDDELAEFAVDPDDGPSAITVRGITYKRK